MLVLSGWRQHSPRCRSRDALRSLIDGLAQGPLPVFGGRHAQGASKGAAEVCGIAEAETLRDLRHGGGRILEQVAGPLEANLVHELAEADVLAPQVAIYGLGGADPMLAVCRLLVRKTVLACGGGPGCRGAARKGRRRVVQFDVRWKIPER